MLAVSFLIFMNFARAERGQPRTKKPTENTSTALSDTTFWLNVTGSSNDTAGEVDAVGKLQSHSSCRWIGSAPFCTCDWSWMSFTCDPFKCGAGAFEAQTDPGEGGKPCWFGQKKHCCRTMRGSKDALTDCRWVGTSPFCDGRCPKTQTEVTRDSFGDGHYCLFGSKAFCCAFPVDVIPLIPSDVVHPQALREYSHVLLEENPRIPFAVSCCSSTGDNFKMIVSVVCLSSLWLVGWCFGCIFVFFGRR